MSDDWADKLPPMDVHGRRYDIDRRDQTHPGLPPDRRTAMTDFDKWQIAEARCADLHARCERLETGAADMRERTAKLAEYACESGVSPITATVPLCEKIAAAIRALPLEPTDE